MPRLIRRPFETPGGVSTMQKSDPIVVEVRAARDALAKESDYDIEKLAQSIKAREVQSGREVVRLAPRKVTVTVRKAS
jgi:biopolymer transport protein ExbD